MESPRYRLILKAYRGGCDYRPVVAGNRFGVRSMLRTQLFLDIEFVLQQTTMLVQRQRLESAYVPVLEPSTLPEILRSTLSRHKWLHRRLGMELYCREPATTLTPEALTKLYTALEKAGLIKDDVQSDEES